MISPFRPIHAIFALIAGLAGVAGCADPGAGAPRKDAESVATGGADTVAAPAPAVAPGVVDSILPIEEEIRRFRAAIGDQATGFAGGAPSRDELVAGFVRALEAADTAAALAAAITPAEFIDLYFPHTIYTRPPYQMDPAVIWFQMQNHGSRGLSRALDRFGGRPIDFAGYTCPDAASVEGPNRVWEGCTVRIGRGAAEVQVRLFGMIVERGGRFKFVSLANGL